MTERDTELKQRLVIGHKRDGRSRYDAQAKRELIERALQPGVSVARLALDHGVNANLLRTWIWRHRRAQEMGMARPVLPRTAFVPVVPTIQAGGGAALLAILPNGVRLELAPAGGQGLATVLRHLWALPCSGSTPA